MIKINKKKAIVPSYGSLYEYTPGGTYLTLTDADTYYQWVSSVVGVEKGAGYVVGNATNDNLTLGALAAGKYKVDFHMNFDTTHGASHYFAVHVDNVAQNALTTRIDVGAFPKKFPDSIDVVLGTLNSGTVTALQHADSTYVDVQEITGDTGFIINYVFSGVFDPHAICFNGYYDGGNVHEVEVQARNYNTTIDEVQNGGNGYTCIRSHTSGAATEPGVGADWAAYWKSKGAASGEDAWVTATGYVDGYDDLRAAATDIPITTIDIFKEWGYPADTSPYVSSGACIVRFIHASPGTGSHQMFIDKLCIDDNHISTIVGANGILDLAAGEVVDLRMKSSIASERIHIHTAGLTLERLED
ncbi:hypothetical protein KAR91_04355 [Candidatus Pacearchaeota archaeon]|nr:hypothetical protein [Candidatus Pacearchaeota archaeon]